MTAKPTGRLRRFGQEIRELARTARRVWRMVQPKHRLALIGAVCVMSIGGMANTALPLLSGRIVDRVKDGLTAGADRTAVLETVAVLLVAVACLVIIRELLQVLRRFLVENTCTRIERHLSVRVV